MVHIYIYYTLYVHILLRGILSYIIRTALQVHNIKYASKTVLIFHDYCYFYSYILCMPDDHKLSR